MTEKQLPHNLENERAVLGSIMIDPAALHRVTTILSSPLDFYAQPHQWIYKAMLDLNKGGVAINQITVMDVLERRGQQVNPSEVGILVSDTPTSLHAEHYARIVADYATRRNLLLYAGEVARAAYDTKRADPTSLAHKLLMDLDSRNGNAGLVSVAASSSAFYDQIEAWAKEPLDFGQVRGLATHITSIDHLTGGLEPGTEILLAGRPSMGKSALALDIGRRVGMDGRGNVAIFELEMTRQSIMMRWASAISKVDSRKVKRGVCPAKYEGQPAASYYVTAEEMGRYAKAMGDLSQLTNVLIDDTPALSASEIRSRSIQKAHDLGGLDLVIVDHTTIIKSEGAYNSNSAKAEGHKSQAMKELAKELDCPLILVQQLNRATEGRENKRPTLSDLRDSGEHEQNADVVLGLYRESYYKETIPGTQQDLELEVIGLKSRDGPTAKVKIRYERHLSAFSEFTKDGKR